MFLNDQRKELMNSSNNSFDGFVDGCFLKYNAIACTRDGSELVAAVATAICCGIKLFKLHYAKHELWNQYLIFYSAIAEMILLGLNWIYLNTSEIDLVAELLKLFQFMVVCRFYCEVASRLAKTEALYRKIFLPALAAIGTYFMILTLLGIIQRKESELECLESVWIQLSGSEVVLGVISIIIGVYITKETNKLKTDILFKRHIKYSLWGIILSFLTSSLVGMAYDILMLFIGEQNQCKGIFIHNAVGFTTTHLCLVIFKWLLPLWAMIIIYKPESFKKSNSQQEESEHPPVLRQSSEGIFKSEFRPRGKSFNYKHLRNPEDDTEREILAAPSNSDNLPEVQVKKKKRNRSGGSSSTSPSTPKSEYKGKKGDKLLSRPVNETVEHIENDPCVA